MSSVDFDVCFSFFFIIPLNCPCNGDCATGIIRICFSFSTIFARHRDNIPESRRWSYYGFVDRTWRSATAIPAITTRWCANGDMPCVPSNDRYIKQARATCCQVSSVPGGNGKWPTSYKQISLTHHIYINPYFPANPKCSAGQEICSMSMQLFAHM